MAHRRRRPPTVEDLADRLDQTSPQWKGRRPRLPVAAQRRCPWCGAMVEASDGVLDGMQPKAGDCSVCFGCTRLGVFEHSGAGLNLRRATPAERAEYLADPIIAKMLQQARATPMRQVGSHQEAMRHVERWRDGLLLDAGAEVLRKRARPTG